MHRFARFASSAVFLSVSFLLSADVHGQADEESGTRPLVTTSPSIEPRIHALMQSRSFDDAIKAIDLELAKEATPHRDYLTYLKAVAYQSSGQLDSAIDSYKSIESEFPRSDWVSRARFGRASVAASRRQYNQAGEIYRTEAKRLLSRGRKDELSKIYLEFADRFFEGVPASDPSQAKQPDYQQALEYYREALKLGPSIGNCQQIEFRIARCQQQLDQYPEAIQSYEAFLVDHGSESATVTQPVAIEVEAEVWFQLGLSQLEAGQPQKARRTWQNFLRSMGESSNETVVGLAAKAQYRLAHTYGLPKSKTIGDLELAVGLAEGFLEDHPDHELAAKAELEIAQGYRAHGRILQAVDRLEKLISNDAYTGSEHLPIARNLLGQSYLVQREFDKAIEAWKTFLENHPTDPKWPEVQTQIIGAEYQAAADAHHNKEFAKARELWQTFLNKYPLDKRAAYVLYLFGEMNRENAVRLHEKRVSAAVKSGRSAESVTLSKQCRDLYEAAIADWRRVAKKYAGSGQASQALLRIGQTLELRLDRRKEALEAYKKVTGRHAAQAKLYIARLTQPQLRVVTERKYRSDEKPKIKLTTRNLEEVSVKVYKIDMADYFRKMHLATGVEKLDIALIDPDEQFVHTVKGFEAYKQVEQEVELPLDGPGVTAVTVSSEKLEATTMVVVSDLDVIVKSSRNELFLFAQNMRTGKPASDVSVMISDGDSVYAELVTDQEGIARNVDSKLKTIRDLRVFAIHEGHVASTVNNLNGLDFAVGLSPTGHLFSDRPVYRPGELVNIKGIVRWVDGDRFTFEPGSKFTLDVYDTRGRKLKTERVALNPYGTVNTHLMLPESTPQGNCRIHLHRAKTMEQSALSFESSFRVQTYKLEPIELSIETDKNVYFRGDEIIADVMLKYYYGAPLARETIEYAIAGDGEKRSGTTDEDGKLQLTLPTDRFSETQAIRLNLTCPQRNVSKSKTVFIATRGFHVAVATDRNIFLQGETFDANVTVIDPAGDGVATEVKLQVFEVINSGGSSTQRRGGAADGERLVDEFTIQTDPETGKASKTLTAGSGRHYIVRATAVDQFDNDVSGQTNLRVSGDDDKTRLRILAEHHRYRVGDTAEVRIHWREEPSLALVTFEGASVLGHRLIELKRGNNRVSIPMESQLAPNFFLSAAVMQRNRFHEATSEFFVAKELTIEVSPDADELQPGEKLTVDLTVRDSAGNPTSAELAVAMIQANLLDRFGGMQTSVVNRFLNARRTRHVRQSSSCTFSYATKTREVNESLLAEADRIRANEREEMAMSEMVASGGASVAEGIELNDLFGAPEAPASGPGLNSMNPRDQDLFIQGMNTLDITVGDFAVESSQRAAPNRGASQQTQQMEMGMAYNDPFGVPQSRLADQMGEPSAWSRLSRRRMNLYADQGSRPQVIRGLMRQINTQQQQQLDPFFDLTAQGNIDASFLSKQTLQRRDVTVNGLTAKGQLIVLNGRDRTEVLVLAREDGVQVIPLATNGETGFWDPTVVTDENGKARLEITMPTDSTAWRLQIAAVNKDGLTGEAGAELITRKTLFGQMRLPSALTVGDKSVIQTEIHNGLEGKQRITVILKTTMGDTSNERRKVVVMDEPGIVPVDFPITVGEADEAGFELRITATSTETDEKIVDVRRQSVKVQPYGLPVYQTASGTASQNTIAILELEDFPDAKGKSLELLIGSNVNRALLDSVLGGPVLLPQRCIVTSTLQRSAADCMGGVALLEMVRSSIGADTPQASQLSDAVAAAISNLIASQRKEGGWSNDRPTTVTNRVGVPSPMMSARIMWALSVARDAGFAVPNDAYDRGKAYLKKAFASETRLDQQAILLGAMARSGCGDFALANRLYRERNRLTPLGVTHLMLALNALNHKEMARELVPLVDVRKFSPSNTRQGTLRRDHSSVELGALYLIALQELNVQPAARTQLVSWLLSKRVGARWALENETGPAIVAVAKHQSSAQPRGETFQLNVYVNGKPLKTLEILPNASSERIEVPLDLLKSDGKQQIEFEIDGRGEFTYSAVMTGFADAATVKSTTNDWQVSRRYEPDQKRLDGKLIPRGFGVVRRSKSWKDNPLTELPRGARGQVTLRPRVGYVDSRPRRAYLVLIEPIPSGCTILEESITGTFDRYEITPGTITFYLGDHRSPSDIRYTLVGYLPGEYRVAPSVLRSYYDPGQIAVSETKSLTILAADQPSSDQYRLTPDELFHFGKGYFEKGDYQEAHQHLSQLLDSWELHPDPYKETVTHLFNASMKLNSFSDTVKYFEIMKERFPDVEVSFESILKVAAAYREIGEYERSYLVYRATVQGSFERENQVAGFLNKRGEFLRSVQTMESLLRDYPAESYVATASYALSQEVYRRAETLAKDQKLRNAGVTRVDLIGGSIKMLDHFVTRWPDDPSSDQASFALTTGLIDLQRYDRAIERAERYAEAFPESKLLDSFWYMIGYCHFELQDHKLALEMCRKVAEAQFKDPRSGISRESENKWEAIYIMAQVYHSLGNAAEAIDEYAKVSERFSDAAEAIEYFSRKAIELPDVTTLSPSDEQQIELKFRNLSATLVKVYRIDLMKFGLTQRNLDRITAINLAGIKPYHQETVELGDGIDYRDRERKLDLPLEDEGAYLVVCRSENLYTSGLVVVSPLEAVVQEDAVSGRVRVSIKNRESDSFVGKVHVKVIGSGNDEFQSGETDLRGLFVADTVRGTSTVIAVSENQEYAFFRGSTNLQNVADKKSSGGDPLGSLPQPAEAAMEKPSGKGLLRNVFEFNRANQKTQQLNFNGLIENGRQGIKSQEAY